MKKHFLLLMVLLTALPLLVVAQGGQRRGGERVHAAKVAYISDRIQLTPDQAARFWPIYNEYESERKMIRRKYRIEGPNNRENLDEATAKQNLEDNLDLQQDELDLKRKYKDEFLKVISPGQLADLMRAEKEFRQLIMRKLRDRRRHNEMRP
jgi:hypothetical protein